MAVSMSQIRTKSPLRDLPIKLEEDLIADLEGFLWRNGVTRDYFCAIAIMKLMNEVSRNEFSFTKGYVGKPIPSC